MRHTPLDEFKGPCTLNRLLYVATTTHCAARLLELQLLRQHHSSALNMHAIDDFIESYGSCNKFYLMLLVVDLGNYLDSLLPTFLKI